MAGKVPMMLMPVMLLMPTAVSCEPCLHRYRKAEISLNLLWISVNILLSSVISPIAIIRILVPGRTKKNANGLLSMIDR